MGQGVKRRRRKIKSSSWQPRTTPAIGILSSAGMPMAGATEVDFAGQVDAYSRIMELSDYAHTCYNIGQFTNKII